MTTKTYSRSATKRIDATGIYSLQPKNSDESKIVRKVHLDQVINDLNDEKWDDLRAPATAINPPGQVSDPDWDNTNGGFLFDAAGIETIWIIMQMPHGWKQGSNIRPHLHWMPTNTNTGNVLWRMEYKWTNIHDADESLFTTVDVLDTADGIALKHQIAGFGEISGEGKGLSSMLTIKLSRMADQATDTYNTDALLKEFDIHYISNDLGSREEYRK